MSYCKCSVCGKCFKDEKSTLQHGRDYHKKRFAEVMAVPYTEYEETSEAEYLIESYYK